MKMLTLVVRIPWLLKMISLDCHHKLIFQRVLRAKILCHLFQNMMSHNAIVAQSLLTNLFGVESLR
uniref:Uncharacterized protein n=1 Tax=Arundo donax TaxID=35708 RepID=A0A0A9E057_ARUDO